MYHHLTFFLDEEQSFLKLLTKVNKAYDDDDDNDEDDGNDKMS